MARVCEICGRREERIGEFFQHDLLDVCDSCSDDRYTSIHDNDGVNGL